MNWLSACPLAVVFDLDGVLLDSAPLHKRAFEEIFEPFGISDFDYRCYAGWKTESVIEDVMRRSGRRQPAVSLVRELAADGVATKKPLVRLPTELTARQRELIEELAQSTGEPRAGGPQRKRLLDRVRSLLDE
jgi:beta-phosphoglucomutase-like phosphatase (HAD superfamily)